MKRRDFLAVACAGPLAGAAALAAPAMIPVTIYDGRGIALRFDEWGELSGYAMGRASMLKPCIIQNFTIGQDSKHTFAPGEFSVGKIPTRVEFWPTDKAARVFHWDFVAHHDTR